MRDNDEIQAETQEMLNSKKKNEEKYKELNLRLEEQRKTKHKYIIIMGTMLPLSCIGSVIYVINKFQVTILEMISYVILGIIYCIFLAPLLLVKFEEKENAIKRELIKYELDDMQEDIFENSIKMSYKYLDQYYLQTREQAQRGFLITVCVSIFGAVLIGIGIIAMFLEKTNPSYVTCASGVITEFIAAVFFYLYNKTITSMSNYHNKLVLSQNVSIALKVADSLPGEDEIKAKDMIISELLKDINSYLIQSDTDNSK